MPASLRLLFAAAAIALAAPGYVAAQQQHEGEHHDGAPARRAVPPPARPAVVPHGPSATPKVFVAPHGPAPGATAGPHPANVPSFGQFSYHGHMINRVHRDPFVYPRGWGYRRWFAGAFLPPDFLVPAYYYPDWAALGLEPPPMGTQWLRYGPDLLLVDTGSGQIIEVIYGVFA